MRSIMSDVARRCPSGKLPESYLVVDFETNGLLPSSDRVLSVGYLAVRDRVPVGAPHSHLVKHGAEVVNPPAAFAANGITPQMMAERGLPHAALFAALVEALEEGRRRKCMVLGHNFVSFDALFLSAEARRANCAFQFEADDVLDTGMLVKAQRLQEGMRATETLREFFRRVYNIRSHLKWGLDWCHENYGLKEFTAARGAMHDAGDDCLRTHYVFERLRQGFAVNKGAAV